jgi:dihydrofolate synthase / folylpolyglutamate synthase
LSGLTYPDLVRELFPRLTGGIRWGLERTARLLAAAGDPHHEFPSLLVGGTNGKGSAAATMASVLARSGLRTGLYTSPHLCTFRERIQVDGRPVTEEALLDAARVLWPAVAREAPSFFEATTAIGLLALARAGVEVAVLEVGLGGRLDATNVVTPAVSVLTNVALDHAQYLGDTPAAIAGEKAGIIKAGVPAVTAETAPEVAAVFRRRAAQVGAPFHELLPEQIREVRTGLEGTRFTLASREWGRLELCTPLPGRYQAVNAALAVEALGLLPPALRPAADAVVAGVAAVRWPGRLQVERQDGVSWVFDAAHNPAAVAALVAGLAQLPLPRPVVLLLGIMGDKDWRRMLPPLFGAVDAAVLTVPGSAPPERRWYPAAALAAVPHPAAEVSADFGAALARARTLAARRGGTVLVTGSFHTLGDAMQLLGLAPHGADLPLPAQLSGL